MAKSRVELQTVLEGCLGSRNVYFQPPSTIRMSYPAIVYKRTRLETKYGSNKPYIDKMEYQIILIDRDPESSVFDALSGLPLTKHSRTFMADDLNHDVFTTYF